MVLHFAASIALPFSARPRAEQELSDELQFHLEQKTHEYIAAGFTLDEAQRKAHREFGGIELSKENCRDTRRVSYLQDLLQDLRFGLRMLRKSPGFTFIAVLTLALGIGANTAIFSMVNSFLLKPLPVKDPEQITVLAFQLNKGPLQTNFSIPELEDLQAQTGSIFSDVIGDLWGAGGLTVNGKTEPIYVYFVTGNYFTALDIKPHLGRFILPSEGSTTALSPVIVLGYNYWKARFAGDPSVVGQTIAFDGHPVTVVGITPKEFHGLYSMADIQGYMPLSMEQVDSAYEKDTPVNRDLRSVFVYGRLLPGINIKTAQSALDVIASRLAAQNPKSEEGMTLAVYPERFSRPNPDPDKTILKIATLFLILAGLVLILACVNVANFLLVRATARQRELAIRTALGGTRGRLIRQLLTESIVLALCGGIGGVLLGLAGSRALSSIQSPDYSARFDRLPIRLACVRLCPRRCAAYGPHRRHRACSSCFGTKHDRSHSRRRQIDERRPKQVAVGSRNRSSRRFSYASYRRWINGAQSLLRAALEFGF